MSRRRAEHRQRGADLHADLGRLPHPDLGTGPAGGARCRGRSTSTDAVPTAARPVSAPATRARADGVDRAARRRHELRPEQLRHPRRRGRRPSRAPGRCRRPRALPAGRVDPRRGRALAHGDAHRVGPLAFERRVARRRAAPRCPSTAAPVSIHTIASPSWIPAAAVHLGGGEVGGAPHLRACRRRGAGDRVTPYAMATSTTTTMPTTSSRRRRRAAAAATGAAPWRGEEAAPARSSTRPRIGLRARAHAAPGALDRSVVRSSAKPIMRSSGTSAIPVASSTRRRTSTTRRAHVVGGGAGLGLEEVGVLGRHHRTADPEALEPERVDEAPGGVARWVGEHRARVRAPPGWCSRRQRTIAGDLGLGGGGVAVGHPEGGPGDDLGGADRRAAVAERQRGERSDDGDAAGGEVGDLGLDAARRRSRVRGRPRSSAPRRRRCRGSRRRTRARCARRRRPVGPGRGAAPRPRPARVAATGTRGRRCSNSPSSTSPRPANPASATSRLEPRPTTRSGGRLAVERVGQRRELGRASRPARGPRPDRRRGRW